MVCQCRPGCWRSERAETPAKWGHPKLSWWGQLRLSEPSVGCDVTSHTMVVWVGSLGEASAHRLRRSKRAAGAHAVERRRIGRRGPRDVAPLGGGTLCPLPQNGRAVTRSCRLTQMVASSPTDDLEATICVMWSGVCRVPATPATVGRPSLLVGRAFDTRWRGTRRSLVSTRDEAARVDTC